MDQIIDSLSELLRVADAYEQELPEAPLVPALPQAVRINQWIEHTLLRPEATVGQIKALCDEAREYEFVAVCVNPIFISLASGLLANSPVKASTVVSYPLGANSATEKVVETLSALAGGAVEIEMVMSVGALKGGAYGQVYNEIQSVAQVAHNQRALLKVAIETPLLTHAEKIIAALLVKAAGADFVTASTGFAAGVALVEDIDLLHRVAGPKVKIKATGGIETLETAKTMISAGAARLGTNAGVQMVAAAG